MEYAPNPIDRLVGYVPNPIEWYIGGISPDPNWNEIFSNEIWLSSRGIEGCAVDAETHQQEFKFDFLEKDTRKDAITLQQEIKLSRKGDRRVRGGRWDSPTGN